MYKALLAFKGQTKAVPASVGCDIRNRTTIISSHHFKSAVPVTAWQQQL
jgi:hypothetical protein